MACRTPDPRKRHPGQVVRRVEVCFTLPDGDTVRLEYAATPAEATGFTAAMTARGGTVVVDENIHDRLRRLPCHRLWA